MENIEEQYTYNEMRSSNGVIYKIFECKHCKYETHIKTRMTKHQQGHFRKHIERLEEAEKIRRETITTLPAISNASLSVQSPDKVEEIFVRNRRSGKHIDYSLHDLLEKIRRLQVLNGEIEDLVSSGIDDGTIIIKVPLSEEVFKQIRSEINGFVIRDGYVLRMVMKK